jgi:hypothetical protein
MSEPVVLDEPIFSPTSGEKQAFRLFTQVDLEDAVVRNENSGRNEPGASGEISNNEEVFAPKPHEPPGSFREEVHRGELVRKVTLVA